MRGIRWGALLLLLLIGAPATAQNDPNKLPTGVRLGLQYSASARHRVAVRPFAGPGAVAAVTAQAQEILRRDLDYSDRFVMADLPVRLASGKPDYRALDDLDLVWMVAGEVQNVGGAYALRLELHDVVNGSVKQTGMFTIPAVLGPSFRMAVHAAADEVVRWITGQPGMAASRIAYVRRLSGGRAEILMVDSDGENVERVLSSESAIVSPTMSPDGRRIAFATMVNGNWELRERDLESGRTRTLSGRPGLNFTPAYSPDGQRIVFALTSGTRLDLHEMDASGGAPRRITNSPRDDLSPTFSPDGRRIAFNSNRLSQPHIYVMSAGGGEASLLSPYTYGEPGYYTSPDWQPTGSMIAFHGRSRGNFQIMLADAARPGAPVIQLTAEGENEDPSWAPDGRHLVFSSVRSNGAGLYVIDTVTGRVRPLVTGQRLQVPDWSPSLLTAAALASGS